MFRFELGTRVNVPGSQDKAQGVVTHQAETVPGYPVYSVKWLVADGTAVEGMIGEGDLAVVNPPEPSEWVPVSSKDIAEAINNQEIVHKAISEFREAATVRNKRAASRLRAKKRSAVIKRKR